MAEKEPTTKDAEEARLANTQVTPVATPSEVKDAEAEDNAAKVEAAKEGVKPVVTKTASPEQKAAERAGVADEALDADVQNRAPKNQFEKENQKVTEKERKAAQKESNMSTEDRVKSAPAPEEIAKEDAAKTAATNQGSEIAKAIADGLAATKEDKTIKIVSDDSVTPRFSVVKNKQGEVMLRENETGVLSKVQLESIEEKEASIQGQEVEEV
jgi:hypothetical protein